MRELFERFKAAFSEIEQEDTDLFNRLFIAVAMAGRAIHFDHTTVMYFCQQESRLAVAEYLQGGSPLIPIKRMNYQTGEITVDYIPEKKQKWIKIN